MVNECFKSKNKAMEEILQYCKDNENFTVLEIASNLELDLFFTLSVLDEMINQGLINICFH